jgi:peptide/nickel transport system permease protein
VISRLIDAVLALPFVLIAIAIIANRGASIGVLLLVLALTGWAQTARIVRAETLGLRERRFVLALRAAGASNSRIAFRHILPNLSGILVVLATLQVGTVILIESALSYLGLGVPPPDITWGSILAGGKDVLTQAWWITTFPGIAITVVVLLVNLLGDALLTTFDPKKRRY